MKGLLQILVCWTAGNLLGRLTGGVIPGNIIGMVLLFAGLRRGWFDALAVRPAAEWLLGTMALFFVPFGVGLVESWQQVADNLLAIVVSTVLSTVIVLFTAGHLFQYFNFRKKPRE